MSVLRKRPVTAQRIAYWKAADFLGSGACVFKKGAVHTVGFWTWDADGKREFRPLGEGASWDEALQRARAAAEELRRRR